MINEQLINPKSIVVIGGSNDLTKPRGKILKNILNSNFQGKLYVTNQKEKEVQGLQAYSDIYDLPEVELAVVAIPAIFVPDTVEVLSKLKNTKAFIVISAGFSEESAEGRRLEKRLVNIVNQAGACLIGPNCIGILTPFHHSVFTEPIPKLKPEGCDLISSSGATCCFILESGIPKGLIFANIFAVGNGAQTGVEEVLEYLDESYDPEKSSKVKLLYIENIPKPQKLLKHATSLIKKGCKIAAIKAGSSEAGSRAASSHTGALASPDVAVDALFRKAGIVRCVGREELIAVGSVFMHKELKGKDICIITHAGGPAVMLTDTLSNNQMNVPQLSGEKNKELLAKLFPGSSTSNPIDFLATGTAEQLGNIIDYVDTLDNIDGMVVIYGSPGLFKIHSAYNVLNEKMKICNKPIFPVLPSTITAKEEVEEFLSKGRINFSDPVMLGNCLAKVYYSSNPVNIEYEPENLNEKKITNVILHSKDGYLNPANNNELLDIAGIPRCSEKLVLTESEAISAVESLGFPVVMKVVGPVHKTDVQGVVVNVKTKASVKTEFKRLMNIKGAKAVLIQPMHKGIELFVGAKYEPGFGHIILCGLGGIFIEVFKDVSSGLAPLCHAEALDMIRKLKSYKIIKGVRGKTGTDENLFADIIVRLSNLLYAVPEIMEIDLNPLIATENSIVAVDSRINIKKS